MIINNRRERMTDGEHAIFALPHSFIAEHIESVSYPALLLYAVIKASPQLSLKEISDSTGIPYPTVRYNSVFLQQAGLLVKTKDGKLITREHGNIAKIKRSRPDIERVLYTVILEQLRRFAKYRELTYVYTKYTISLMQRLMSHGIASEEAVLEYMKWLLRMKRDKHLSLIFICGVELVNEYKRSKYTERKGKMHKRADKNKFARMANKYLTRRK
jgi:predicted transcriptional regulator